MMIDNSYGRGHFDRLLQILSGVVISLTWGLQRRRCFPVGCACHGFFRRHFRIVASISTFKKRTFRRQSHNIQRKAHYFIFYCLCFHRQIKHRSRRWGITRRCRKRNGVTQHCGFAAKQHRGMAISSMYCHFTNSAYVFMVIVVRNVSASENTMNQRLGQRG